MAKVEDYVVRMEDEAKCLRAKMYALKGFLNSDRGNALPAEKRFLMERQLTHMTSYEDTLQERIKME